MLVLANTITADMGMIPGMAVAGPALGLPLSVLAAFLERPFYSLAGVKRDALWYSLQANLISLGIGFAATLLAALITDSVRQYRAIYEVWPFVAVCVSIVVERLYLRRRIRSGASGWGWPALGNILSACACVAILYAVVHLRAWFPDLRQTLAPYAGSLQGLAFIGSSALFIVSFIRPHRRGRGDVVVAGERAAA